MECYGCLEGHFAQVIRESLSGSDISPKWTGGHWPDEEQRELKSQDLRKVKSLWAFKHCHEVSGWKEVLGIEARER